MLPQRIRSSGVRIDELKHGSCRYIISTDYAMSVRYCGQTKERGSYCGKHAELCYLPPASVKALISCLDSAPQCEKLVKSNNGV